MSTAVLPTLKGLTFDVEREMLWNNQVQQSISGKETRIAYWSAARYRWTLTYSMLRSDSSNLELQSLFGFCSARQGSFDSFLYQDSDDNSVTGLHCFSLADFPQYTAVFLDFSLNLAGVLCQI